MPESPKPAADAPTPPPSRPDAETVLSVRDVVVEFERPDGGIARVLDGITFDVKRGETLVIMGPSGCGKSTMLNCLIGELAPVSGTIRYHLPGQDVVNICSAEEAELEAVRKRIGILFQSGALFSSLSVAENVALPLREHSIVDDEVIDIVVALKLQQVHMLAHRDKLPSQLSGGQKKRVGLARATAMDPDVLFYDEPSAGLDPVTSSAIDELINDLTHKLHVTSVVVTHEMDSAFAIATRMVMLDAGRVLHIGTREAFAALRDAPAESLTTRTDQLIHQFVRGEAKGPLTAGGQGSEFEKLLLGNTKTGADPPGQDPARP